jgi:hypothetical protein
VVDRSRDRGGVHHGDRVGLADMTNIERLQKHLDAGNCYTVRTGSSAKGQCFATIYSSRAADCGDHAPTIDEALGKALDKLDAKFPAPKIALPGLS